MIPFKSRKRRKKTLFFSPEVQIFVPGAGTEEFFECRSVVFSLDELWRGEKLPRKCDRSGDAIDGQLPKGLEGLPAGEFPAFVMDDDFCEQTVVVGRHGVSIVETFEYRV